ncbi:MAG: metallophosphoesterase [Actinobacteria bacterium]|nr:MAG: metallophosphoesterase [Actinomycetota bacterium]
MILVVSDVHGAFDALAGIASTGETLFVLGDLANLTDYRTGEGAVATALGIEFAKDTAKARGEGDFDEMRRLWRSHPGDLDQVRSSIEGAIADQYKLMSPVLEGVEGYVIHGNVDRPNHLIKALPSSFRYVHGECVEIGGLTFGFAGGGVATPLQAPGEVTDEEMEETLAGLNDVDVLCTHVAPAIDPLRTDVITGRQERSSDPILRFIRKTQPRLHLFGDIHQPQASRWRIGATRCVNVGYFRATGRPFRLDPASL